MSKLLDKYGKALVPAAIAVATAAQAPLTDGRVNTDEVIAFLIAVNAAVSVYIAPALHFPWVKTAVGVVNAVLMALAAVIVGGINAHDTVQLILAALMALGVKAAHAESDRAVAGDVRDEPYSA